MLQALAVRVTILKAYCHVYLFILYHKS